MMMMRRRRSWRMTMMMMIISVYIWLGIVYYFERSMSYQVQSFWCA
jgi:hypothetical protein